MERYNAIPGICKHDLMQIAYFDKASDKSAIKCAGDIIDIEI